jgi:hypothetical protein
MEVDPNKLKELSEILSMVKKDKKKLPKLIQFEKENTSILYYTELLTEKSLLEWNISTFKIIKGRINEINFFNHHEYFITKMIFSFSSPLLETQTCIVLCTYFSRFKKNSEFILTLFEAVSNLSSNVHPVQSILDFVEKMDFDSNILKFYKKSLKLMSKNVSDLSLSICLKILLELENVGEDLISFYPDIRLIMLESKMSINYVQLISLMIKFIPNEDFIIFEKFEGVFKDSDERENFYNLFLSLFEENRAEYEAFSSM